MLGSSRKLIATRRRFQKKRNEKRKPSFTSGCLSRIKDNALCLAKLLILLATDNNKWSVCNMHWAKIDRRVKSAKQLDFALSQRRIRHRKVDNRNQTITRMGNSSPPAYCPDLAPSDYRFFASLGHAPADQHFHTSENMEKWLAEWFVPKTAETATTLNKMTSSIRKWATFIFAKKMSGFIVTDLVLAV